MSGNLIVSVKNIHWDLICWYLVPLCFSARLSAINAHIRFHQRQTRTGWNSYPYTTSQVWRLHQCLEILRFSCRRGNEQTIWLWTKTILQTSCLSKKNIFLSNYAFMSKTIYLSPNLPICLDVYVSVSKAICLSLKLPL